MTGHIMTFNEIIRPLSNLTNWKIKILLHIRNVKVLPVRLLINLSLFSSCCKIFSTRPRCTKHYYWTGHFWHFMYLFYRSRAPKTWHRNFFLIFLTKEIDVTRFDTVQVSESTDKPLRKKVQLKRVVLVHDDHSSPQYRIFREKNQCINPKFSLLYFFLV